MQMQEMRAGEVVGQTESRRTAAFCRRSARVVLTSAHLLVYAIRDANWVRARLRLEDASHTTRIVVFHATRRRIFDTHKRRFFVANTALQI